MFVARFKKKANKQLGILGGVCVYVCVWVYMHTYRLFGDFFLNSRKKLSPYVCAGALKTLMCNFNFHDNVCEYFI